MGQKVNPNILRIGVIRDWDSKWFATKHNFAKLLHQDLEIRKIVQAKLQDAAVSKIEVNRTANKVYVNIHSAKPGIIIGRQGAGIEALKEALQKKFHEEFTMTIKEISKPALDATLLAESIKQQIEKRVSYRRAARMAIDKALETGALGAKVFLAGRLNGVEIARSEFFAKGKIPLHTLRADIDYCCMTAHTAYGAIGVKVWIYKGDIFKGKQSKKLDLVN